MKAVKAACKGFIGRLKRLLTTILEPLLLITSGVPRKIPGRILLGPILLTSILLLIPFSMAQAQSLPDATQDFTGYSKMEDGSDRMISPDNFFILSVSRNDRLNADNFGAYISDMSQDHGEITDWFEINVNPDSDLGSFELTDVFVGEYDYGVDVLRFEDVVISAYQGGTRIAETTPYASQMDDEETRYPIDYSVFEGISIDRFRVTFTTMDGTPPDAFNLAEFTIQEASTEVSEPSNQPPVVDNPIPDQSGTQDAAFSFTFDENTFSDPDGDELTYSAQLSGGDLLPVWLTFDAATRTFSGTPTETDTGSIIIEVTADDGNGGTVTDSFTLTVDALPAVTAEHISISGASGDGGTYIIGDTVTATWDNTTGGDNNSDINSVTVNFSEFGGGAAVEATNSSGTWTATYTIVAGSLHATNRNVSVTATDNSGNSITTAGITNATVDNVAPMVNGANISISGASGTLGTYKIGDTVTATWDNTAGGDNNSDINIVTVNFSEFGGGEAVVATNSSGTWTATYTIVAGTIEATNRNVSVTATDASGNTTTTKDTSNATVDNIAPTVISVGVPANGTYTAGQNLDFIVNTDEDVTVNTSGGTPRVSLTIGATTRYASYLSGSGTSALVFRYTVQAGDSDDDGIAVAATVDANGGTLLDGAGNDLNTTLNSVGSTAGVLVDAVAPNVSAGYINISGASGDGGTYIIGDTVTATWDNTTGGDNNNDINSVTMDFSEFGGGAAVVTSNNSDIWSASYTITYGSINEDNRNISVSATNDNGTTTTTDNSNASVNNIAFPIGSGTEAEPYEIATADQLNFVRDFLDSHFKLTADIDLGVSPWSDGEGWEPLSDHENQFTGQFDGNGHYIYNLKIIRPDQTNLGLFGINNGKLLNITLEDAYVEGRSFVGVLAGNNYSNAIIENSKSTGKVVADNIAGGLVGHNSGNIRHSRSSVTIEGFGSIGGLVGTNGFYGALIENSFATGNVSGDDSEMPSSLGGLVGSNRGSVIRSSFATGSVTGTSNIGGLVGSNRDDGALIEFAYSSGLVNAIGDEMWIGNAGGLVGSNRFDAHINQSYSFSVVSGVSGSGLVGRNDASVTNSFWDLEESGQSSSGGGTGLTTSELKSKPTFTNSGWNFETVWQIIEPSSGSISYPYLLNNEQDPPPGFEEVGLPTVVTLSAIEQITPGSAQVSGEVTDDGNMEITATGFIWATDDAPGDTTMIYSGSLDETITDLPPGTALNVRAFAENAFGLAYGDPVSFETLQGELQVAGTFTAQNKIYDGAATAPIEQNDLTLDGVYSGHDVLLTDIELQFSDSNAGDDLQVTLNTATLGGDDAGRYTLTLAGAPKATADITPRAVTIAADQQSVVYGEADPDLTYDITSGSLVTGDELSGSLARTPGADVGTYSIEQGDLDGGSNYDLTYVPADFEITPKTLDVVATADQSKVYGETDPSFTFDATNFGWDDDEQVLNGGLSRESGEDLGSYSITQGGLEAGANYTIDFTGADFEITPLELTLSGFTADDKTYDGTTTVTGTGFDDDRLEGDELELSYDAAFVQASVGESVTVTYSNITISGGADAGNYTLVQTEYSTEAEIHHAPLVVTEASADDRTYDGTTDATISGGNLEGIVGNDEVVIDEWAGSFAGPDAGTGKSVEASLTLTGADAGNYRLIQPEKLKADIHPKKVHITGVTAADKVYDGTDQAELTISGSLDGVLNGEKLTLNGPESVTFENATAGTGKTVTAGGYSIGDGSGGLASNYVLEEKQITVEADIFRADFAVTVPDDEKVVDGSPYSGGPEVQFDGFVEGENELNLSGVPVYGGSSQGAVEPGTYTISVWGFTSVNYDIEYFSGTLTIFSIPVVQNPEPSDDSDRVEVGTPIRVGFDQSVTLINPEAVQITYENSFGQTGTLTDIVVTLDGNILVVTHSGLSQDTDYKVSIGRGTVESEQGVGNEPYSWSFTTMIAPPARVELNTPEDGEGSVAHAPQLSWHPADQAVTYRLQLAADVEFNEVLMEEDTISGLYYDVEYELDSYHTYFWRVQSSNYAGNSQWSDVYEFVTEARVPGMHFPEQDADMISTAPTIQWDSPHSDTRFRFQLAGTESFDNPVVDTLLTETFASLSGLGDFEFYHWRVKIDGERTASDWSQTRTFLTRPAPVEDDQGSVALNIEFGGSGSTGSQAQLSEFDYRLVGLPGADRYELAQFFEGEYGSEWRAFYDTGADTDYYEEFDEIDDRFRFEPGLGFWVLSTDDLNAELQINSVEINEHDGYSIDLHPGWNIISNPHRGSVAWHDVLKLNEFQADLYEYDQRFALADTLQPLQGYYVYNHPEEAVETLDIPYSPMERRRGNDGDNESTLIAAASQTVPKAVLEAIFDDGPELEVELVYPGLKHTMQDDPADNIRWRRYYPSLEMSRSGMMLLDENIERGGMIREQAVYSEQGEEYELKLKGDVGHRFTWSVNLNGLPQQTRILLVNPVTNQSWLLADGENAEATLSEPEASYSMYVGTESSLTEMQQEMMPQQIVLEQNYPNPFNPVTNIRYSIPNQQHVRVEIYDTIGRRVQVLQDGIQQPGWHLVQFDGNNLSSGVYFYRLQTEQQMMVGRMTLIK